MTQSAGDSARRERDETSSGARDLRPEKDGLSPLKLLAFVLVFALLFGFIVTVKLKQEWDQAVLEAEGIQARSTAFMSEVATSEINRIDASMQMVAELIENRNGQDPDQIQSELNLLAELDSVTAAAFLDPDGLLIATDPGAYPWRVIADPALASPSGVTPILGDSPLIAHAVGVRLDGGMVGGLIAISEPRSLLPALEDGQIGVLATTEGRALALYPSAPVQNAPSAPERFGLEISDVTALNETGGALSGARFGDQPLILGSSPVRGSDLILYTLGPPAIDYSQWRQTLFFYILMFLGPLLAAMTLCSLLLRQMSNLKSIQTRLISSEERFRLAIEGARCGVWDWDLDTDEVFLTESFSRMVGQDEATTISGSKFLELFDQGDQHRLRAAVRSSDYEDEVNIEVRAAQLALWLQVRGRPSTTDPGDGSRRIVGVAIDITERKGAQARVAAAESRLRAALESMSESFVLWDSRRRLILWNKKFREFFGLVDAKLRPGMPYHIVEKAAGRSIEQVFDKEHGQDFFEMKLTDGRWLNYSERVTADGGLVSVGADITALKKQETSLKQNDRRLRQTVDSLKLSQQRIQELARSYEEEKIRAEEANRSKSEFLANMSHELRTPLNAINGFSEMMMKEIFGPLGHERYQEYAGDIFSSGEHLLSLINDILDMSKIEAGKMDLSTEPILPGEIIEQCLRLTSARAAEKNIKVKVEGHTLPEVEADPRAVKQVLLNLISNAVKFTPAEGKVTISGHANEEGIILQVIDTGIGIPEEDLPRLGRPFEQIESHHSKKHEGSGLGLALSKSLIQLHGGSLKIESIFGQGTTVSFTLPFKPRLSSGIEDDNPDLMSVPEALLNNAPAPAEPRTRPSTQDKPELTAEEPDNTITTPDEDDDVLELTDPDGSPETKREDKSGDVKEDETYLGSWTTVRGRSSADRSEYSDDDMLEHDAPSKDKSPKAVR